MNGLWWYIISVLSHLTDVRLEQASTSLNPAVELSLRFGRLYLTTPNAVYSFDDLYDNFSRTFEKLDFSQFPIRHILILGFGMGSIPMMLEKRFKQHFDYVGVEGDPVIASWATKYAIPRLSSRIELVQDDACRFVSRCSRQFDMVIVDVFVDDTVPEQFEQISFLKDIKKVLNPNGLLLYNRLADTPLALEKTRNFYTQHFCQVFSSGCYHETGGNWMLAQREWRRN